MNGLRHKPKPLIFIAAYHAESTIASVMRRLPADLTRDSRAPAIVKKLSVF